MEQWEDSIRGKYLYGDMDIPVDEAIIIIAKQRQEAVRGKDKEIRWDNTEAVTLDDLKQLNSSVINKSNRLYVRKDR